MKPIFLALVLLATGVHAAEDTDSTPCDGIENDKQTLECASYNKTTAEQLLKDNYRACWNAWALPTPATRHSWQTSPLV